MSFTSLSYDGLLEDGQVLDNSQGVVDFAL